MRILLWFFYCILALLFIWLSVVNRHAVTIELTPFDYALDMPLFFVVVLGITLGFLILGPVNSWKRWRLNRQIKKILAEQAKLEAKFASVCAERDRLAALMREGDLLIDAAQNSRVEKSARIEEPGPAPVLPPQK